MRVFFIDKRNVVAMHSGVFVNIHIGLKSFGLDGVG